MRARRIDPGGEVGAHRGEAVICLPSVGPSEWLQELLALTPAATVLLGCDADEFELAGEVVHRLVAMPGGSLEQLIYSAGPADVVLLQPGATPPRGWYERLQAAAGTSFVTATASALTPALLDRDAPPAEAVAQASLRLHPRLLAPGGPCVYVRRAALDLAAPLGERFPERCRALGLAHVLADDLLVAPGPADRAGVAGLATIPVLGPGGPRLARALGAVRRVSRELQVTIDARELRGSTTGTHVAALELIGALAARPELRLSVLLPAQPSEAARDALGGLPHVTLLSDAGRAERADVVHRPFQVSTPADLGVLARLGERLVITHHDLIAYHNAAYFSDHQAWAGYRQVTAVGLAVADAVVFVSEHAREDALAEDLLDPDRAIVVRNGVDHSLLRPSAAEMPHGLQHRAPFMLCLGTDYRHKNRLFALRLLEVLRERQGWDGALVLAGPSVAFGSSREEERAFLAGRPGLAGAVQELGAVSEPEKLWLLEQAALVLYPSVEEGFGLLPFEAAAQGTPCLWAPGGALGEFLAPAAAGIVPWDAEASAPGVLAILRDPAVRTANLQAIRAASAGLRWQDAAVALVKVYRSTCEQPASPAGARERLSGLMGGGLSEDALRLVGPGGAIPPDVERPLLALAARPHLAAPLFWLLRAGYALSRRRT